LIHLFTSCEGRGVCKEVPVVGVHLINAKGSKLIEPDKAESQAMMVMSDDPILTNFEKTTSFMAVTTVTEDSSKV
jgi:hypothetical protein